MNRIQKNLFDLLIEIDDICHAHDIKYYLAFGNSLGAIRHNKFLPWDDDIDLFMSRDNWNKLVQIVETDDNVLPEGRALIYNENTPFYSNPLARYVRNDTTNIYISQTLAEKACGQHIEIFILDPLPLDEKEKKEYIDLFRVYVELISPYFIVCKNLSLDEWKKHYEHYKIYCDRIDREGEEKVLLELENKLHSISDDECEEYIVRWGIFTLIFKKSYFEGIRKATFENQEFPNARGSECIFRYYYGDDWMYVPEISKQKTHNAIRNLDVAFSQYTNSYIPKVNKDELFKKYKKNKRQNMDMFYKRRRLENIVAQIKVNVESKEICNNLNNKEENLRFLLDNGKYDDILTEFDDFISLQMEKDVKKYNIHVPISDENLSIFLLSLIELGKYFEADKYLNIRKSQDMPMNEELNEISDIINFCRQLSIARYDLHDKSLVKSIISKYENTYPNLLDIYRAKLWIKELNAKSIKDYKDIDELCKEILELYPFDGETMAYQAKAKFECGLKEEAKAIYNDAIRNTRNGFIWQKVENESGISRIEIERELLEVK